MADEFVERLVRATPRTWVTAALIAANVAVWLANVASGMSLLMPRPIELLAWGGNLLPATLEQPWRVLAATFLHAGLPHLAFNMWALWVVGPPLERWLGRNRFVALYVLSALGGGVLAYLMSPLNSATAGASGAIFGLFGATFIVGKRVNMDTRGIMAVIVINLAFTFVIPLISSQNISWQGHIGGLVTGVVVAWLYAYKERNNSLHVWASVGVLAVFAALVWWRTQHILALIS